MKRLTKPHEKNARLETPFGLLGVPPDFFVDAVGYLPGDTVIIVTNNVSAQRMLNSLAHPRRKSGLTQ